nr:uncharacterized protein LOC109409499 [Aedes albopictus]
MDKNPKAQVIAKFWDRMEETIGYVPVNVMRVVNFLGLSATSLLGDITSYDVARLEASLCWNRDELWTHSAKINYYRDDCFGMGEDFRSFEFSFVERKCVLAIARAVKLYGLHYFIDERKAIGFK